MTRMGTPALEAIEAGAEFVPCLHTVGAPGDDSAWPCDDEKYIRESLSQVLFDCVRRRATEG